MNRFRNKNAPNKTVSIFFLFFIFSSFIGTAYGDFDPYANWNWRNPLPQGETLRDTIYANGKFVAVGHYGTILTSPDGINWTRRDSGTVMNLIAITYGNSLFVVVGSDRSIFTSPDGIIWTRRFCGMGRDYFYEEIGWERGTDIAFGNSIFIASGWGWPPQVLLSYDGIHWSTEDVAGAQMGLHYISYGNSIFCATNMTGDTSTSPDGIHWSPVVDTHIRDGRLTFGNSQFIIVGGSGDVSTSPDGIDWTLRVTNVLQQWSPLCFIYGGSTFFAGGQEGKTMVSSDCVTWNISQLAPTDWLMGAAYGDSIFILFNGRGNVLTSPDALTWTRPDVNNENIYDICRGDSRLVAVGARGSILTSEEGKTWSKRNSGTSEYLYAIAYGNSLFAAVGTQGTVVTSPAGMSWTKRNTGFNNRLYGIAYGNSKFVTVGNLGATAFSYDGITWTSTNSGTSEDLASITYGENMFAAIKNSGGIIVSADGLSWEHRDTPLSLFLKDIIYGNGLFVILGSGSKIITTTDFSNWKEFDFKAQTNLESIYTDGEYFAASGSHGKFLTSKNGFDWTYRNGPGARAGNAIIRFNGTWLIVSGNGIILQTDPFFSISGNAGAGTRIKYKIDGTQFAFTDPNGYYSFYVPGNWSGTVIPRLSGHWFTPSHRSYDTVGTDFVNQDYVPRTRSYTISGTVRSGGKPLPGAAITFSHDNHVETTGYSGSYSYSVPFGATTTVTPSKTGYTFLPVQQTLNDVYQYHTGIDFAGSPAFQISAAITSPTPGETVSGVVFIEAEALSTTGSISGVDFYIGSDKVKTDTMAPYQYRWDTVPFTNGPTEITAIAYGLDGNSDRHTAAVTIANPVQPPVIEVNRTRLNFAAVAGGPVTGSQEVTVQNTGGGRLNWSASGSEFWCTVSPGNGTGGETANISVDASWLSPGRYSGAVIFTDPEAENLREKVDIFLTVMEKHNQSPPFGSLDLPLPGTGVSGDIPISGWVLDDIEVRKVRLFFHTVGAGLVLMGEAHFIPGSRPDIAAVYPGYPFQYRAGWGYLLSSRGLPGGGNGIYSFTAEAEDISGNKTVLGTVTVDCDNSGLAEPFGTIETPAPNETVSGSRYVNWGWVLTPQPNSIPVDGSTITVYIDGRPLDGHPVYNIYRSDIASMFPGYANSGGPLGYFIIDTTMYSNGIHTISWTVSDGSGNTAGIGSRYFKIFNRD